jgi:phosphohistidine phosphatase
LELWLVRHAIAEDFPSTGTTDGDRALTDEGRKEFRRLCRHLAKQGLSVRAIRSSPLLRARQTAEILAHELGLSAEDIVQSPHVSPGFDPAALGRELTTLDSSPVAAVGHQPDLGHAVAEYLGGGTVAFGKGHIACIKFDGAIMPGRGRLSWFVGPDFVER